MAYVDVFRIRTQGHKMVSTERYTTEQWRTPTRDNAICELMLITTHYYGVVGYVNNYLLLWCILGAALAQWIRLRLPSFSSRVQIPSTPSMLFA